MGEATKGPGQSEPEGTEVEETMIGSLNILGLSVNVFDLTVSEMESHYRVLTRKVVIIPF